MADVTISSLTKGTPSGNHLLPYSTGSSTLAVPISALLVNAGNISIGSWGSGTSWNPINKLQVFDGAIASSSLSDNNDFIRLRMDSANNSYGVLEAMWDNNPSLPAIIAINPSGGKVGIGTTTPTAKLEVSGDVKSTTTAKAWASFNGQGALNQNQTIYSQYNVSSVVKANDGRYTVNFTNAFSNTNYCIFGTTGGTGGYWGSYVCAQWGDSEGGLQTTTSCRVGVMNRDTGWTNLTMVNIIIFGN